MLRTIVRKAGRRGSITVTHRAEDGAQHRIQGAGHGSWPESLLFALEFTPPDAEQTFLTDPLCKWEQKALRSERPRRDAAGYQPEGNARLLLEHSLAE